MSCWFLLAGLEPEKLRAKFVSFYSYKSLPQGVALWKWKKTFWICSPENYKDDILNVFNSYGITEFFSAPSPSELEFIYGDASSLKNLQK
jgi:hypothetical protein